MLKYVLEVRNMFKIQMTHSLTYLRVSSNHFTSGLGWLVACSDLEVVNKSKLHFARWWFGECFRPLFSIWNALKYSEIA